MEAEWDSRRRLSSGLKTIVKMRAKEEVDTSNIGPGLEAAMAAESAFEAKLVDSIFEPEASPIVRPDTLNTAAAFPATEENTRIGRKTPSTLPPLVEIGDEGKVYFPTAALAQVSEQEDDEERVDIPNTPPSTVAVNVEEDYFYADPVVVAANRKYPEVAYVMGEVPTMATALGGKEEKQISRAQLLP